MSDYFDNDGNGDDQFGSSVQENGFNSSSPMDVSDLNEFQKHVVYKLGMFNPYLQGGQNGQMAYGQSNQTWREPGGDSSDFNWRGNSLHGSPSLPGGGGLLSPYVRPLSSSSQPVEPGSPTLGTDGMTAEQERDLGAALQKHNYPEQFLTGIIAKPKDGDARYAGMTEAERVGRIVGENIPVLDTSRQLGDKMEDITGKIQRGEPVGEDVWIAASHAAKTGIEAAGAYGLVGLASRYASQAASGISNVVKQIFR